MPGAASAASSWSGREPFLVVAARALAPWPLWLVLWRLLQGGSAGGSLFVLAATAVLVSLMVRRASRGADRPVSTPAVATVVALALGANVFLAVVAAAALPEGHLAGLGGASAAVLGWLAGAVSYELAKRCLVRADLTPPHRVGALVDLIAHQVLLVAPLLGVVDVRGGGLPLPLVVGPLVAVRVAGWHDARMPAPSGWRLAARTALGGAASLTLLAAILWPGHGASRPEVVAWVALPAAVSSLAAALVLVARAGQAGRALWGVVYEHRSDGVVLSVRGGAERVHVVPSEPRPGGGLPRPECPITLLDVQPIASDEAPYRQGPPMLRARVAWHGTSDELASSLLARAWGWLAWSALCFAAVILVLG